MNCLKILRCDRLPPRPDDGGDILGPDIRGRNFPVSGVHALFRTLPSNEPGQRAVGHEAAVDEPGISVRHRIDRHSRILVAIALREVSAEMKRNLRARKTRFDLLPQAQSAAAELVDRAKIDERKKRAKVMIFKDADLHASL